MLFRSGGPGGSGAASLPAGPSSVSFWMEPAAGFEGLMAWVESLAPGSGGGSGDGGEGGEGGDSGSSDEEGGSGGGCGCPSEFGCGGLCGGGGRNGN